MDQNTIQCESDEESDEEEGEEEEEEEDELNFKRPCWNVKMYLHVFF